MHGLDLFPLHDNKKVLVVNQTVVRAFVDLEKIFDKVKECCLSKYEKYYMDMKRCIVTGGGSLSCIVDTM